MLPQGGFIHFGRDQGQFEDQTVGGISRVSSRLEVRITDK